MSKTNEQPWVKKLESIQIFQCALCGEFSLGTKKPGGCPICKEGNPFMESVGIIQLTTPPLFSKDELCPLCFELVDNGKNHGSWCK